MSSDTNLPETTQNTLNNTKSPEKEKIELLSKLDLLRSMGYEVGTYTSDTCIEELELVYQIARKNEEDRQENQRFNYIVENVSKCNDPCMCSVMIFIWICESREKREDRAQKVFTNEKLVAYIDKTYEIIKEMAREKRWKLGDYAEILKSHGIGS